MPEQLVFKNRSAFRDWLRKNHARPEGLWLIFGKNRAIETLTSEEALEEALCFGWIDGLVKRVDETQYIKFFSPRRTKSNWSEKNIKTAERLIQCGRMTSSGKQAIERAKQDGSWDKPARGPIATPEDIKQFAQLIIANPKAAGNFQKMPQSVKKLYAGYYRDAKQETTRRRRLEKLIVLLEQNKRPMM